MQQRTYGEAEELVGDWDGLMNGVFGAVSPSMRMAVEKCGGWRSKIAAPRGGG